MGRVGQLYSEKFPTVASRGVLHFESCSLIILIKTLMPSKTDMASSDQPLSTSDG